MAIGSNTEPRQETHEEELKRAMQNAEAIAKTLVHHGVMMKELEERVATLTNLVSTLMQKQVNLESLYHRSLVNKYGNGSTSGE